MLPKISSQHSPIADLEYHFAIVDINKVAAEGSSVPSRCRMKGELTDHYRAGVQRRIRKALSRARTRQSAPRPLLCPGHESEFPRFWFRLGSEERPQSSRFSHR